jgi:hypothetical protein
LKDASGLIQDRLEATNLGSLTSGQTWMFTTTITTSNAVSHAEYVSYIDGQ